MKIRTAGEYLPCFRPGAPSGSRLAKAAQIAGEDAVLRGQLEEQVAFDTQILEVLRNVELPKNLRRQIQADIGTPPPRIRHHVAHPAILGAIASVVLCLGFLGYTELQSIPEFPGQENAALMVASLGKMTGAEFEPVQGSVGSLADWFYMRGFDDFALPPDLKGLTALGARTLKVNGNTISQAALDQHATILNVFRAADFGIRLSSDEWAVFEEQDWAAALRQNGELCTMLAFRGTEEDMRNFLTELEK